MAITSLNILCYNKKQCVINQKKEFPRENTLRFPCRYILIDVETSETDEDGD